MPESLSTSERRTTPPSSTPSENSPGTGHQSSPRGDKGHSAPAQTLEQVQAGKGRDKDEANGGKEGQTVKAAASSNQMNVDIVEVSWNSCFFV